jgi:hypothetical protein
MSENRALSIDSIVSAVDGQLSADLNGEIVILHLESGIYFGLDNVGAGIWNLIQEPISVSDVRDAMLEEYNAEPDQCERDVLALLGDLEDHKLVEIHA